MPIVVATEPQPPEDSVAWISEGRVIYTVDGRKVGTMRTPKLARQVVESHNASL